LKVVLLAGGFGTRLAEYTDLILKPMVKIGNKPILWHIMKIYSYFGFNDFIIALGYKSEIIKSYFLDYINNSADISVDLSNGEIKTLKKTNLNWKVTLVDTGLNSMTGGRIKRLEEYIGNESFLCTYGDGVSDININELVKFHKSNSKIATISTVRPSARFGELIVDGEEVKSFKEKPRTQQGWINGGFFVFNPEIFKYLKDDKTVLEEYPLEKLASENQLSAFKHEGFWQCMDNVRDRNFLQDLWDRDMANWKLWN